MSDAPNRGAFTGDPAAALAVSGTSGCCGNPAQTVPALPGPDAAAAGPCCGTPAEAAAADRCCGTAAKTDAVAAGAACCG